MNNDLLLLQEKNIAASLKSEYTIKLLAESNKAKALQLKIDKNNDINERRLEVERRHNTEIARNRILFVDLRANYYKTP